MLLVVELVELLVVEKLEESLVELRDVVPPVFVELHGHHDAAEYGELSVRQIQSL